MSVARGVDLLTVAAKLLTGAVAGAAVVMAGVVALSSRSTATLWFLGFVSVGLLAIGVWRRYVASTAGFVLGLAVAFGVVNVMIAAAVRRLL